MGYINFNNDSSFLVKNYIFVLFVSKKKQNSLVRLLVKVILKLIWDKIIPNKILTGKILYCSVINLNELNIFELK